MPPVFLPILENDVAIEILVIGLVGAVLFVGVQWWKSRNENSMLSDYERLGSGIRPKAIRQIDKNSAPLSTDLGRIRVLQFNFAHFDAVPGPPNPDSFADELIVELFDPESEHSWTMTFVIATPAGIRRYMDEERWSFFHASEIFVVRNYDLALIREAVFGRIREMHEEVGLHDWDEPPRMA